MSGDLDIDEIKARAEAEMEIFADTFGMSPLVAQAVDSIGIVVGVLILWQLGGPIWTVIGLGLVIFGGLGTAKRVVKYGPGGDENE